MGCFQRADYTLIPKLPNTKVTKGIRGRKMQNTKEINIKRKKKNMNFGRDQG
jgi:hypothetical protein